jgi:hypothetical protein
MGRRRSASWGSTSSDSPPLRVDWSERRLHLAGSLGGALAAELLRRDWVHGREASRVVDVTPEGLEALSDRFGVDPGELGPETASRAVA